MSNLSKAFNPVAIQVALGSAPRFPFGISTAKSVFGLPNSIRI